MTATPRRTTNRGALTPRRLTRLLGVLVGVLVGTTACSTPTATPAEDPRITEARAGAWGPVSKLDLEILADGVVTDEEYLETRGRWKTCLEDLGFRVWPGDRGARTIEFPAGTSQAEGDAAIDACDAEHLQVIEMVYLQILDNPDNDDEDGLIAECLVRNGIVDDGFTRDDMNGPVWQDLSENPTLASEGCRTDPTTYTATDHDRTTPFVRDGETIIVQSAPGRYPVVIKRHRQETKADTTAGSIDLLEVR